MIKVEEKIPMSIELAGITIKTIDQPGMLKSLGVIGGVNYNEQVIMIDIASASKDTIMQVYVHEVIHFILFIMGKEELNDDEEFVDLLAHFVSQAIKSAK